MFIVVPLDFVTVLLGMPGEIKIAHCLPFLLRRPGLRIAFPLSSKRRIKIGMLGGAFAPLAAGLCGLLAVGFGAGFIKAGLLRLAAGSRHECEAAINECHVVAMFDVAAKHEGFPPRRGLLGGDPLVERMAITLPGQRFRHARLGERSDGSALVVVLV